MSFSRPPEDGPDLTEVLKAFAARDLAEAIAYTEQLKRSTSMKQAYEYPPWLTPDHFAHSPEWYEAFLGVPWTAIVMLHAHLASEDETIRYQARHVLGLTDPVLRKMLGQVDPLENAPKPVPEPGGIVGPGVKVSAANMGHHAPDTGE